MINIITNNFNTHLIYVPNSTFAAANPPITTPEVGVIKLISPLAPENIIIITSGLNDNCLASGANIGIDTEANPEVDGIKNDNSIYNKYDKGANT